MFQGIRKGLIKKKLMNKQFDQEVVCDDNNIRAHTGTKCQFCFIIILDTDIYSFHIS